jgi:ATP-dependent helicase/DNAse subunit B
MPAHLLLAPAGRGKTAHALDRIRAVRKTEPLSPIWVILPNRPQVSAFRRRLAAHGGAIGVQTGTFYAIYADLLARAGQPAPRLLEPVQYRLLQVIVDRLTSRGHLYHFAPLCAKPGFIRALCELIQELKQARIEPQALVAVDERIENDAFHLRDLASIYTAYQDWLVSTEWVDAEGQGWLATNALKEQPRLVSNLRLLIVDGFDEFNPTQLAILKLLSDRAIETLVLLTGDVDCDRLSHRRFVRAIKAVAAALEVKPEPLSSVQSTVSGPLAHLEAFLFEPIVTRQPGNGAVTCIKAQNRAQEVRAALRWVKARLVRHSLAPREIAVLARDLTPYRPFLNEIAAEFGLPLRMDFGIELATNPAVAALMALLALPVQDWPRRPVIDAWRSPYFDWQAQGIVPAHAGRLDAAARARRVIGGLSQWREALKRLEKAGAGRSEATADKDVLLTEVPAADEAARLRAQLDAFVTRITPPVEATVRDYVTFVEDLIGDDPTLPRHTRSSEKSNESLRIVACAQESPATRDRDVAALRAFKDVLRGLALAEAIFAENGPPDPLPYHRFYRELGSAVKAATFRLPAPETTSSILVAPVLRARGLSFHAVVLLGLAEGEFPRVEREGSLLPDADRERLRELGLPLKSHVQGDEVTIFYEAISLARKELLLTRPYLADDGQTWEASPYWQEVRRLVDVSPQQIRSNDPISPHEAASLPELAAAAASDPTAAETLIAANGDLAQAWGHIHDRAAVLRARQSDLSPSPHEGNLAALAFQLSQRYAPHYIWSASRLEAYAVCPMHFLFLYDLALEPRPPSQEGFDVLALGSMYHNVLEQVYDRSPTDPLYLLEKVAQEVFDAAPEQYGFRPTALWEQQKAELVRILADTIVALTEASQGYEPLAQEKAFGIDEHPPLVVPFDDGDELRLRGFIDRLDRDTDGSVRVVDYKAGSTPITAKEIAEGQRVQLPLYALAVRDAVGLGEVSSGFYWHVRGAKASSFKLEKFPGGVEAAIQTAIRYARAYVSAIRQGQFPPEPPQKGCPAHCPAVDFCWRYTPR